MSSVRSFRSQRVTNTYVVTQDNLNGENGAYYFLQSDIDAWYEANIDNITKVGSLYTIRTDSFADVLGVGDTDLGILTSGKFDDRKSLTDMGGEIVIGNDLNSRLIVLRRVMGQASSTDAGSGTVAYVAVENYTTDVAPNNAGRFTVRVARI